MKKALNLNYLLALLLLVIIVFFAYMPASKLFFRNDDWDLAKVLESKLHNLNDFLHYLIYYNGDLQIRHFVPISLGTTALEYLVFGNTFQLHYYFSLFLHLCNILLVYFVCFKIYPNRKTALASSILFASSNVYADTIFWTLQITYIHITTYTLISIFLHPALNKSATRVSNILFYIFTGLAPFVYELGFITILLSIAMLVINKPIKIKQFIVLVIILMLPFLVKIMVKPINAGVYFSGFSQLIYNIFIGCIKLLLGFLGAIFEIKVTDTLYILNPAFPTPLTIIAILFLLITTFYTFKFIKNPSISRNLKTLCVIFFIVSLSPFFIASFAYHPSNPNPDLSHQMPRYFYFSAALISIPLAQIFVSNIQNNKFLIVFFIYIIFSGMFSVNSYINTLKPYTDDMKNAITVFENTGKFPVREHYGTGVNSYRLDWSFNEESIKAYLKLSGSRRL